MGFILPRMLVVCVIVDTLLRFAPIGWRPMDAGEGAVSHRVHGEAYARNLRTETPAAYGDLSRLGNLKTLREYRSSTFTTDDLGFRNRRPSLSIAAVVFGDSFAESGTDDNTLAEQLGRMIGCKVYNAAGPEDVFQQPSLSLVESVTARIPFRDGIVIMERVERLLYHKPTDEPTSIAAVTVQTLEWGAARIPGVWRLNEILEQAREQLGSSPLESLSDRAFRVLKDDQILPNSYGDNVVTAKLRNGDWILFYPPELATYEQKWPVNVSYFKRMGPELARRGFMLVVILVPNKYTVYYPWLSNPRFLRANPGELLDRAEAELRAASIQVVNLTRVLSAAAEKHLGQGEYLYWRDDTHWNGRGVAVGAEEIVRNVPGLRQACQRPQ